MSKIRWHLIYLNLTRKFTFLESSLVNPSFSWNSHRTFKISSSIDIFQKPVPISLYICSASFTIFGTRIPNLWEVFQYLSATLPMMRSHLFATPLTHQQKIVLNSILIVIGYDSNYRGVEAFRYFSGTHHVDPSLHLHFHPAVVFLGTFLKFIDLMNPSLIEVAFT